MLIHGMGGLGKSSLATRLCDRLLNFERIVQVGRVDEPSLVSRLAQKLDNKELRQALQNPDEELKFRLRRVFRQLQNEAAKPFLLVLDDFEWNRTYARVMASAGLESAESSTHRAIRA